MRKLNLLTICALISVLMACKKETKLASLPDQSISFDLPSTSDVIEMPGLLDIKNNVTMKFEMKAALMGSASTDDHYVSFAVDTSKIAGYIAKYGNALVLPATTYLFYKPIAKLAAGETKSEAAQLNLAQQTTLKGTTTYILPVVIRSVDGKAEGAGTGRVVYYVFKTGKPAFVDKSGWTIGSVSSQNNATTNAATGMLDANNVGTNWLTNITQPLPQWVIINFNRNVDFTAFVYYYPVNLANAKLGGNPTSFRIETSMDGTTWVNKGVFAGALVDNMQIVDIGGATTAMYLRFTVLSVVKYAGLYDGVAIAGISLVP